MLIFSLIHAALVLGILLFAAIIYKQGGQTIAGYPSESDIFIYIVPILAMVGYFGGEFMFNRLLTSINDKNTLKQQLIGYLQASIFRFAFLEGASLMSIIAYKLNNTYLYLVIAIVLILYLLKLRPTRNKIISDLKLDRKDQELFKNDQEDL